MQRNSVTLIVFGIIKHVNRVPLGKTSNIRIIVWNNPCFRTTCSRAKAWVIPNNPEEVLISSIVLVQKNVVVNNTKECVRLTFTSYSYFCMMLKKCCPSGRTQHIISVVYENQCASDLFCERMNLYAKYSVFILYTYFGFSV